jgi:DNA ligase-4
LARKEGLVLKPDEPYFDFTNQRRKFSSCCIKLKKEYIGNFGDVGDFAVVGAKYDSTKAMSYRIPGLKWTHFYLGCIDNREAVRSWKAKPEFTIVNVVELNETLLREVVTYSNPEPVIPRENDAIVLKQAPGVEQGSPPTVIFTKPLVFDLKCFSFDRVGNTGLWSLRFPSVTKVHFDRDFTGTISFEQLQTLAKDATAASELEDSQENLQWIAKLEAADPRGIAVDTVSQLTVTTMPTPSPRKSTQNTASTWSPTSPLAARSPGGNQVSPCRNRFERLRPLIPSTAAAASTPAVPLALPTEHRSKQKRDPLISQPASPRKRLKPDSESSPKHKHPPDSASNSQPREPLGDIDDNSRSQPAMTTYAPCPPSHLSRSVSPDNSNSDERDTPNTILVTDPEAGHSIRFETDLETETEPRHEKSAKKKIVTAPAKGCVYAGENCVFAKAVVLISPGLLRCSTAKTLLKLHGIDDPVEKLDAWFAEEKSGKLKAAGKDSTEIYLLCQSNHKEATKSLFDRIQKIRDTIPGEQQNWIRVYDWRVLKHVTIQEDVSIEPKYYEGFSTPWQRWCIGPGII